MTTEHDHQAAPETEHDHEHHHHDHEHVPVEYKDAVEGFRLDKDEFFRTMPGSPIPEAERAAFDGLPYYPIDESMVFEGHALLPYTFDDRLPGQRVTEFFRGKEPRR